MIQMHELKIIVFIHLILENQKSFAFFHIIQMHLVSGNYHITMVNFFGGKCYLKIYRMK